MFQTGSPRFPESPYNSTLTLRHFEILSATGGGGGGGLFDPGPEKVMVD